MTKTNTHHNGSRVRVGVRVRPMASQEIRQEGNCSLNIDSSTIRMGKRRFTYDAVFDSNFGQADLYESVSSPLLTSFVDGYNATIMAYGQTGSGKTFTMGSEAHIEPETSSHTGLIPRFITDFFHEMQRKKAASDKGVEGNQVLLDYSMKASFLEVYGNDVNDLLDANPTPLPLREDSTGAIQVAGLTSRDVSTTAEALQVLHEGTMNRTTAATLMNDTSSRSHAVFTIHMSQVTRLNASDSVDVTTTSQFTFVDLAGSERMKKTGAEGARAREGIKINEGLLALGNVINALASKEKKPHVPYRQSKLTRLLQDALGGNSQTLFLACVSPSDTNASETLSTLNYANRARDIHNAPTKNVDGASVELQRLHNINRVLQSELVKALFQEGGAPAEGEGENGIGEIDDALLKRDDVDAYIQQVYKVAGAMVSPNRSLVPFDMSSKDFVPSELHTMSRQGDDNGSIGMIDINSKTQNRLSEKFDHSILEDINPDEEMAILDHLLELQQHDHEYEKAKKQGDFKLKEMDGELEKQESMLLQLRDSLKVYHGLKGKYEELMEEVQQLESEKSSLAKQLDRAVSDPTIGCSAAIKKKLERVEMNLSRARRDTQNHRQKHRLAEDQARKCKVLERKVTELKHVKLSLQKKQKEEAAHYKKMTDAKTQELLALKRKAKTADKKMSKLENELNIQKKNVGKQKRYCTKISEKLKKTESHLTKLVAMRQRDLVKRSGASVAERPSDMQRFSGRRYTTTIAIPETHSTPLSDEEIKATKYIFDRMVFDKVKQARLKNKYEDLVATYSETMRNIVSEVKLLKETRGKSLDGECISVETSMMIKDLQENIVDMEFKLELLDSELQDISAQMPKNIISSEEDIDDAETTMMKGMSTSALKSILLETFSKFVEAETDRQTVTESLQRKDAALLGVEAEVDSLNFKLTSLSKDLAHRKDLDESGTDHFEVVKQLTEIKSKYEDSLSEAHINLEQSNAKILQLETFLSTAQVELSVSKENLAVTKASLTKADGNSEVDKRVASVQEIWEELGADSSFREEAQKRIEYCLEDTCKNILDSAITMKSSTKQEIGGLSYRLQTMRTALGISVQDPNDSLNGMSLLQTLKKLRDAVSNLEVPYRFAAARRRKIVEATRDLTATLGLSTLELHNDLKVLLQHGNNRPIAKDEEGSMTQNTTTSDSTNSPFTALPPKCLQTEFLTRCDNHVTELRVAKSEMLLKNRELQQRIADLSGEMHLNDRQSLELIESWIKQNGSTYPKWWNSKFAGDILCDIGQMKFISFSSAEISQHLELLCKSLSSEADCRRSMSETLKSVIEHAQKTLLNIVGREIDASEAYADFHDALYRLPRLSKDLITSCISEVEALIDGIEAMTQSETEALIVVWDALKIPPGERRNFWGILEKSESKMETSDKNPFFEKFSGSAFSSEEWMVDAIATATNTNDTLDIRLKKLEQIHQEVERLRSKQDIKSRILSLDSEIRIMNTKLLDFEELQCNKQRLLTKKNGGAALLKEERFRKQMQGKFAANLKQLVSLLRSWERKENASFDDSLLSDDVRELLKTDPNQMDNWVEKRTKLMTLRTVKAQTPRKRTFEASNSSSRRHVEKNSSRHASGLTPPTKRMATSSSVRIGSSSRADTNSVSNLRKQDQKSLGLRVRDVNNGDDGSSRSPKRQKRKKALISLPPFGRILADSPTQNYDNDNM